MKTAFALICAAFLVACGAPGTSEEASNAAEAGTSTSSDNTIDLSQFDMPLLVNVPQNGHEPKAVMNEERGRTEVRAGEHFGLIVTETEPDFARLKADLDRDMLVKKTITQETPDLIVYTSEFRGAACGRSSGGTACGQWRHVRRRGSSGCMAC